ncbi:EPIDERMAL PATTERNING FACTOR-like protein 9 [Macadamia integrifolia]|uniref:EPIDERMAL PATTERNING FACTOR-like protein 9 n=1 Tax=Macadamia integrifolia TaxID=60698 RepID=UPI001C4F433B|nr:EPIDERMAL PATTERNING FACTOR-like protein 9 [Macadamia integrifolia]
MATIKLYINLVLLIFTFLLASFFIQGLATHVAISHEQGPSQSSPSQNALHLQGVSEEANWRKKNSRRLMIGSTAPICTYNECKGCKYKCKAEQIPVDGNDPINSAYHYRCVCHM